MVAPLMTETPSFAPVREAHPAVVHVTIERVTFKRIGPTPWRHEWRVSAAVQGYTLERSTKTFNEEVDALMYARALGRVLAGPENTHRARISRGAYTPPVEGP